MSKKKGLLQRLRRSSSEEEGEIVPRHKRKQDKDKKKE